MLLPKDISPKYSLYYYGGIVSQNLIQIEGDSVDFLELFERSRKQEDISLQSFVLTLDWLYLLGVISLDRKARIKKCF